MRTDRAIGLIDRLGGCRRYEDLNDHNALRTDPLGSSD
jgi:hypothetical protein